MQSGREWDEEEGTPYDWAVRRAHQSSPHIGHSNHLCELADNGVMTLNQMKTLVKDGKFICRKCGRAAVSEESLCEPVPL